MRVSVPSFAKINVGLGIGPLREDGFHQLRTVYQTVALHDIVRISVTRGSGIEIRCGDPGVPKDERNTCHRIIGRSMQALNAQGRVVIEIEKRLPIQGGLGGASGNAVAAMLGLERALGKSLPDAERLRIAAEVGSDLPLFLIGGTVLGVGRGEEVYPLGDLPAMPCLIVLPGIAVSTPKAFQDWDNLYGELRGAAAPARGKQVPRLRGLFASERSCALEMTGPAAESGKLKNSAPSDRMAEFSRQISAWLSQRSGVSAQGGGRAENPLLDLVRTGIENDFEKVVFSQHPELREVKRVLERAGAAYASLSGSGSAIYGLFETRARALAAAQRVAKQGARAVVTSTLTRRQYWKKLRAASD
jgi:4-diphosphocytidyl-2-C-methyl-D-erythritol kinase